MMKPLKTVSVTEVVTTTIEMPYVICLECDSEAINFNDISHTGATAPKFIGVCSKCANRTGYFETRRECVNAWNRQNNVESLIADSIAEQIRLNHRIDALRRIQAMRTSK